MCFANCCSAAPATYPVDSVGSTGFLGLQNTGQIAETNSGELFNNPKQNNCANSNKDGPEKERVKFNNMENAHIVVVFCLLIGLGIVFTMYSNLVKQINLVSMVIEKQANGENKNNQNREN